MSDAPADGGADRHLLLPDAAATEAYKNMLPDTMADALVAGGGIGLATDLVRALRTAQP